MKEEEEVSEGQVLCNWDPHAIPIISQVGGKVRLDDCIEGQTVRSEKEVSGNIQRTITEHRGGMHPQVIVEDGAGAILDF